MEAESRNSYTPELNSKQTEKMFEIVDMQYKWFLTFHPKNCPAYHFLVKVIHFRIIDYLFIEKLGCYTTEDIDDKLEKLRIAYIDLFEITRKNIAMNN